MKKLTLALSALLLNVVCLQAQKIPYESSFEKAKNTALLQHKPLAILITMQPPASVSVANFMRGLDDKEVIEKYTGSFVNYKVEREDTAASRKIITAYKIYSFPSFIFLDSRGGLLFSDIALVSRPASLLAIADKAIAASKGKSLVDYDSAYNAGTRSTAFLKEYILKRKAAGIINNADLIEKYASGLTIANLNDYAEVLFILKAGPVLDSNAYKLSHINKQIVDSIYKTEPLADRTAINNAITQNSMSNAIANKNIARANAIANFTRSSWANNFTEGQKNWYLKMIQYFNGVKDTASYLRTATLYYDQYYMRITVDSIRKKDSLNYDLAKNNARQHTQIYPADTTQRISTFIFSKNNDATELNNAAWSFYQTAGDSNDYLMKAMLWSRRSIELSPSPAFYDTYAHLLYRLKFYEEAESMESKAIESGKAENADTKVLQKEYKKIKTKKL